MQLFTDPDLPFTTDITAYIQQSCTDQHAHRPGDLQREICKFSVIHWSPSTITSFFYSKPYRGTWQFFTVPSLLWQHLFIFKPSCQPPQSIYLEWKPSEAFLFWPHLSFISAQGKSKWPGFQIKTWKNRKKKHWRRKILISPCFHLSIALVLIYSLDFAILDFALHLFHSRRLNWRFDSNFMRS